MCEENFYDNLAAYYDVLQEDIDPEAWSSFTDELISKFCTAEGDGSDGSKILCDLGCGNGRLDVLFAKMGYDVIGIDSSFEMLQTARETCADEDLSAEKALFLNQDITEYELFGTADVFVSLLDTVNHILEADDIAKIFKSFANYMAPGGVFIFDAGTQKHFEQTLGTNVFYQDYEDFTLLWDNDYDAEQGLSTSAMTLFYSEDGGETYGRVDGEIVERYYPQVLFAHLGEKYGMEMVAVLGELSYEAPTPDDERMFFVFRKK